MRKGLTLLELVISISCMVIIMTVFAQLAASSFFMITSTVNSVKALSDARLLISRLTEELQGRIDLDSIQFRQGTAELSFVADYDEDGDYDTIEYYFEGPSLKKRINSEYFTVIDHAEGSGFLGDSMLLKLTVSINHENGIPIFTCETAIRPK